MGAHHSGAIIPLVDPVSKFTFPQPVYRKAEVPGSAATRDRLGPVSNLVLTITADSGREFAEHAEVSGALGADFASPARTIRGSGV